MTNRTLPLSNLDFQKLMEWAKRFGAISMRKHPKERANWRKTTRRESNNAKLV